MGNGGGGSGCGRYHPSHVVVWVGTNLCGPCVTSNGLNRPTTVTLVVFRGLCVDIGAIALIAPSICARLVTNKYFFFTQPSYHPSRAVGTPCTNSTIRVVARLGEKIVFISNQTCTNCWRKIAPIFRCTTTTPPVVKTCLQR